MKRTFAIAAAVAVLVIFIGTFAYFFTDPSLQKTKEQASEFYAAAIPGKPLAEALFAHSQFRSVIFGACGHLDSSPDSGEVGSLIYSPSEGAFARYSSFEEFLKLNPALLSKHKGCRQISVVYMTIFPQQITVNVDVDEVGKILATQPPIFSN